MTCSFMILQRKGWSIKAIEEFINKFDGELLNTGGMFWNDSLKKILLETGVNW